MLMDMLKLIRLKHWLKNGLIFIPIFFAKEIFNISSFFIVCWGFLSFSSAASIIYIVNDMKDIEKDRKHPIKCDRPLASGRISKKQAIYMGGGCFFICLFCNYIAGKNSIASWGLLCIYIFMNFCYSLGLKNLELWDLCILVMGYIIRVYYGAVIINIAVSSWLYLTVMAISFFMALGKRRNELVSLGRHSNTREVLSSYTENFLNSSMYMTMGLSILFYSLWCKELADVFNNQSILFTIPFTILICMKYVLLVEKDMEGDPMGIILQNKSLIILGTMYLLMITGILYL